VPDGNVHDGPQVQALDRRQALRRGVLLGTAPVWTTPLVQAITISPASAQATSPPPSTTTPTDPPGPVKEISNIQIIVRSGGVLYGLKWDGAWEAWSASAPDANDCIRFHADAGSVVADEAVAEAFAAAVSVEVIDAFHWRIALPLPAGYELVAGYSKAGDARKVGCAPAVVSATSADFPGVPG
jgi:hypothetical protein